MGTERSYQNYPSGWAQVSNTPFKFYKTTVWQGGLRTPLIVYGPKAIKGRNEVRSQFVDIIDVTPTILDIVGIEAPETMKGVPQMPMAGISFKQVLADGKAKSLRSTQYFELLGQRAIWHDGWMAIANHKAGAPLASDVWSLYDTKVDFSGNRDLAAANPQILEDLKSRWWIEAGKYGVLPVINAPLRGMYAGKAASGFRNRRDPRPEYTYYPEQAYLVRQDGPQLGKESYAISAKVDLPSNTVSGVLISDGDRFGGYSLYLEDGYLTYEQSDFGRMSKMRSNVRVERGAAELGMTFHRDDASGGTASLLIDNKVVSSEKVTRKASDNPAISAFSIGRDAGGPVSDNYPDRDGFPLPSNILEKVVVKVTPSNAN